MATRVSVVVNPRSGAGRTRRTLINLERALRRLNIQYELLQTLRPGHASQLAREACARGCDVLAVVGGDGTLNEVAQAYVNADGAPVAGPPLALIPSGTGGDFARCCGFGDGHLESALARIQAKKLRDLDLGILRLNDAEQRPVSRAFINIASAGISGDVDERVARGPKWLGGKLAFLLATLGSSLRYRNVPVGISIDERPWHEGPVVVVAIANGQFFGGGMQVAPGADPGDGLFDVVVVGDLTRAQFLTQFPKVQSGAHLELEAVRCVRAHDVTVRALDVERPILVDVDGETPGYLPLDAQILPRAVQLCID
ncbi:MAG TPA: diacylglycerol kinase family protein [Polyangiaceae bacterium]|nr:diacylglycerol kinase family protein [Polyangiaceae bacterium]